MIRLCDKFLVPVLKWYLLTLIINSKFGVVETCCLGNMTFQFLKKIMMSLFSWMSIGWSPRGTLGRLWHSPQGRRGRILFNESKCHSDYRDNLICYSLSQSRQALLPYPKPAVGAWNVQEGKCNGSCNVRGSAYIIYHLHSMEYLSDLPLSPSLVDFVCNATGGWGRYRVC